jgi:hypothetical protein
VNYKLPGDQRFILSQFEMELAKYKRWFAFTFCKAAAQLIAGDDRE